MPSPFKSQAERDIEAAHASSRRAESEAAELRQQISDMTDRAANDDIRRRRERQQEIAFQSREAHDWKDALRKYKQILAEELAELSNFTGADHADTAIAQIQQRVAEVNHALALWGKAEQDAAAEIKQLNDRIAEIRGEFHIVVAHALTDKFPGSELSQDMLDGDPTEFLLNF